MSISSKLSVVSGPTAPYGLASGHTVASLAHDVTTLTLDDTISHAVQMIRQSPLDSIPVVSGGRPVCLLTESRLSSSLFGKTAAEADVLRKYPLSVLLNKDELTAGVTTIHALSPLSESMRVFQECPEQSVLIVTDNFGRYAGVITRADQMALVARVLAPARVGGMATPLGVYLTDGVNSGGAGNLGLVLTGVVLCSISVAAGVIVNGTLLFSYAHHWDPFGALANMVGSFRPGYAASIEDDLRVALSFPVILLILRLTPVAGYHAAEHQVVHSIEQGEPLLPQIVARMPRPHPRCGTNLVATLALFFTYLSVLTICLNDATSALIPSAVLTFFTWRSFGTFLQQYLTTRPASPKQLASGIRAGEDLLSKYRLRTRARMLLPLRIWRQGLLQILGGYAIVIGVVSLVIKLIPGAATYLSGFSQ